MFGNLARRAVVSGLLALVIAVIAPTSALADEPTATPPAPTPLASAIVAIGSSTEFNPGRQNVYGLEYIWDYITPDVSPSDFITWSLESDGPLPSNLSIITSYRWKAEGEPAWLLTPTTEPFDVQVRAVGVTADGARHESNPVQYSFYAVPAESPALGTPPTGTYADWAWTAPWATISDQDFWHPTYSGEETPWADSIQCLTTPLTAVTADAAIGTYVSAPSYVGQMQRDWVHAGLSDGLTSAEFDAERVTAQVDSPQSSIIVDLKSACPGLGLTGDLYIAPNPVTGGGNTTNGAFTFSDHALSPEGHGSTGSDVTATPLPDGTVRFDFARTPAWGEAGNGGVELVALRSDGSRVRVQASYSYLNYGGRPAVTDKTFYVAPGDTLIITQAELTVGARWGRGFSGASEAQFSLGEMPSAAQVDTTDGQTVITYNAPDSAGQESFTFSIATNQGPAGQISSNPATARIIVGTPALGFEVHTGIDEPSPVWPLLLGATAVLVLAASALLVLARRRRRERV